MDTMSVPVAQVAMDATAVLGFDIDSTRTRYALRAAGSNLVRYGEFPTDPDYRETVVVIRKIVQWFTAGENVDTPCAIGVSFAGVVKNECRIFSGGNLKWNCLDLGCDITGGTYPIVILNNAQAGALSELTCQHHARITYIHWGAGIGVGHGEYVNGKPHTRATELGHTIIRRPSRVQCGCGRYGHLEAYVGGANIPKRRFGWRRGIEAADLNYRQWSEVLDDMVDGIYQISLSNPHAKIIIGGDIMVEQQHHLFELNNRVYSAYGILPLNLSHYGKDSSLFGALIAAQQLVA